MASSRRQKRCSTQVKAREHSVLVAKGDTREPLELLPVVTASSWGVHRSPPSTSRLASSIGIRKTLTRLALPGVNTIFIWTYTSWKTYQHLHSVHVSSIIFPDCECLTNSATRK